jgi:Flp pilus assembly protein TadD
MREAIAAEGEEPGAAVAAADRACVLAGDALVGPALREQAGALRSRARAALAAARAAAETAARDRTMEERLEELRCLRLDRDAVEVDDAFARAYRDYGIDVEALPPEAAAARIRSSAVAPALSAGLDAFAALRKNEAALADRDPWRLLDVARLADPDECRNRLRDSFVLRSRDRLASIAATADVDALPAATLGLLATALADRGDRPGAIRLLEAAALAHPDDLMLHHDLARLLLRTPPPAPARAPRHTMAAVALRPGHACIECLHGCALRAAGDMEGALYWLRRAAAGTPVHTSHTVMLAAALFETGESAEAETLLRGAVAGDPGHAPAWAHLGELLMQQDRAEEAERAYREAARLDPTDACSRVNICFFCRRTGREAEALDQARKAVEADPEHATSRRNLGAMLSARGEFAEGLVHLRRAVELVPDDPEFHETYALWLYRSGDHPGARDEWRRALSEGGDRADALNGLAWMCITSDDPRVRDPEKALSYAKRAEAVAPEDPNVLGTLGLVRLRVAQPAKAKVALLKSIPLHATEKGRAADRLILAMALAKLGDATGAAEEFRLATEWLDASGEKDEDLRRLREEAAALLATPPK